MIAFLREIILAHCIFLWINYAVFEELEAEDVERTQPVYKACLDLLPHKHFTFTKIRLLHA
jgi:crooked neck